MTVTFLELGAKGRTGNAIFQASAAIGYAKKHNIPFIFPKWKYQNDFAISDSFFTLKKNIKSVKTYCEKSFLYSEIPFMEQDCNLSGYFQSWKYFSHCQDYIREVFAAKEPGFPDLFRDICAIHVRRGDYLNFADHHPVQNMDYYNAAIKMVPCKKFMVFSDDVAWCRKNFVGKKFIVTDPSTSVVDFNIMRCCNHFIIANSSFSWWAAWLSEHEDKTVIAPKKWFGPALEKTHPINDLILPEWVLV